MQNSSNYYWGNRDGGVDMKTMFLSIAPYAPKNGNGVFLLLISRQIQFWSIQDHTCTYFVYFPWGLQPFQFSESVEQVQTNDSFYNELILLPKFPRHRSFGHRQHFFHQIHSCPTRGRQKLISWKSRHWERLFCANLFEGSQKIPIMKRTFFHSSSH